MSDGTTAPALQDSTTLVELVNRVVDRGVVLGGEITISVADVELLYLDLRLLLTAADRVHRRVASDPSEDGGDAAEGAG